MTSNSNTSAVFDHSRAAAAAAAAMKVFPFTSRNYISCDSGLFWLLVRQLGISLAWQCQVAVNTGNGPKCDKNGFNLKNMVVQELKGTQRDTTCKDNKPTKHTRQVN